MTRRRILILITSVPAVLLVLFLGYSGWNQASPERTCGSCHEIVPSMETWKTSAHRDISCSGCHGTALSNGWHSLASRAGMVLTHIRQEPPAETIHLQEEQVLEVMQQCIRCHQDEFKRWSSGGHSATYAEIFLNEEHNHKEQLYPDCFRCHGMYYPGNIHHLVEPVSTEGPWTLKDPGKAADPTIPCLACHPVHVENPPRQRPVSMEDPDAIFYERAKREAAPGLYLRADGIHLRVDMLPSPSMYHEGQRIAVSADPVQRLCVQCHAPDWRHRAGSEDDRTPVGVHEGLSCRACHQDHSNDARGSCKACHPAVSNCGLDVEMMNTSFRDRGSPNDIHFVSCAGCHQEEVRVRTR